VLPTPQTRYTVASTHLLLHHSIAGAFHRLIASFFNCSLTTEVCQLFFSPNSFPYHSYDESPKTRFRNPLYLPLLRKYRGGGEIATLLTHLFHFGFVLRKAGTAAAGA
jgi:hypothetical protein